LTDGLPFEAAGHGTQQIAAADQRTYELRGIGDYSMTGGEVNDILKAVKKHALARFSSTYILGFVPSPSGSLREHKLEVKLAMKSTGNLTGGKRSAEY
jgi:hypothetical protein